VIGEPPFWDEQLGTWRVTRYRDIDRILRDPETFASSGVMGPFRDQTFAPLLERLAEDPRADIARTYFRMAFIASDGEQHQREHSFVAKAFTPRRVKALEPAIRGMCDRLADGVIGRRDVPFVRDFAVPLPVQVIAWFLGLPEKDLPAIKRWSDGFEGVTGSPNPTDEALDNFFKACIEFTEYAGPLVEERRRNPGDDLLSVMASANEFGEVLETRDVLNLTESLMLAGNETSTASIAATLLYLVRTPGLQDTIRATPELIPNLVEEGLRLSAPSGGLFRSATSDAEVGGVKVGAGEFVFMHYAAGNRDPSQYEQPLIPLLHRPDKRHLTFGRGPHVCVGAPLARAELRITLEVLLHRTTSIALSDRDDPVTPAGNEITARVHELYLDFDS
jgi:cytochrome P450